MCIFTMSDSLIKNLKIYIASVLTMNFSSNLNEVVAQRY